MELHTIEFHDMTAAQAMSLSGPQDRNLRQMNEMLGCEITFRDGKVYVKGDEASFQCAKLALAALNEIAETAIANGEKNVLVVSSGGIINTIIPLLGGEGAELKNASVTMLYYNNGEFTLGVVGDMSYADRGAELR